MIKLKMKNYSTLLREKQQKCQHYNQVKLINMNYLTGEEILLSNQRKIKDKLSLHISSW